jgi:hypothetical protein
MVSFHWMELFPSTLDSTDLGNLVLNRLVLPLWYILLIEEENRLFLIKHIYCDVTYIYRV